MTSDIELRLLRVFRGVVESGGFTNAQSVLNLSQSTVSNQMALLESRLGFVLCQRGRGGFRLTDEGRAYYLQVVELSNALSRFQSSTANIKDRLCGKLRIGFLDNIITDDNCPLQEALSRFTRHPENDVKITLDVLSPPELENALLNHELDAAISIFPQRVAGLSYDYLYKERDVLVCHPDHKLAVIDDPRLLSLALPEASRIIRTFLNGREFPFDLLGGSREAKVSSLEASTLLILSRSYIGFLPEHYARHWTKRGKLVQLMPEKFHRYSDFFLAIRDQQSSNSSALEFFLQCLHNVSNTPKPLTLVKHPSKQ
jgi:DNA-binding transcriptional LysR family regulator